MAHSVYTRPDEYATYANWSTKGLHEVTKRIISEERRVNNTAKLQDLLHLRDHVFCSRLEKVSLDADTYV